jgi:hypothetical protein
MRRCRVNCRGTGQGRARAAGQGSSRLKSMSILLGHDEKANANDRDVREILSAAALSADPQLMISHNVKLDHNILTISEVNYDLSNYSNLLIIG